MWQSSGVYWPFLSIIVYGYGYKVLNSLKCTRGISFAIKERTRKAYEGANMQNPIKMSGSCHWREAQRWIRATVKNAIYRPAERVLAADYVYGEMRGSLEVSAQDGDDLAKYSGTWRERGPDVWQGTAELTHTVGGHKHVFIGTWTGDGGPGEWIFDLDEVSAQS